MVDVDGTGKITAKQFITGVLQLQSSEASKTMTQLHPTVQEGGKLLAVLQDPSCPPPGADTETAPQLDERRTGAQGAPRPARHAAPPARRTRARHPSDTGSLARTLGTVHEPGVWIAVQG